MTRFFYFPPHSLPLYLLRYRGMTDDRLANVEAAIIIGELLISRSGAPVAIGCAFEKRVMVSIAIDRGTMSNLLLKLGHFTSIRPSAAVDRGREMG